jgi:Asp-tRNA(Asn)/Glu-tRNA(Gln) amidotransferase A subunit family amidase
VPVSLKDQFNLKGFDSTLGYVGRSFHPADEDCVLVKVLKQLGAVIIAKTNLPQSILVRKCTVFMEPNSQTDSLGSGVKQRIPFGA